MLGQPLADVVSLMTDRQIAMPATRQHDHAHTRRFFFGRQIRQDRGIVYVGDVRKIPLRAFGLADFGCGLAFGAGGAVGPEGNGLWEIGSARDGKDRESDEEK